MKTISDIVTILSPEELSQIWAESGTMISFLIGMNSRNMEN